MKKLLLLLAVVSVLAFGAMAFAHGTIGMGGGFGGHMGPHYGGHMMGWFERAPEVNQKFLDDTADVRRELHEKKFAYREAVRNSDIPDKELLAIEKEIYSLQEKIREKAPRTAYTGNGRYGHCW